MQVKALACELPVRRGLPFSRLSVSDIAREACASGIVATISKTRVWNWLHEDAIRPWCHRSWLFPRDPSFAEKAGRILDLYHRTWNGEPLTENEFVLSADEKTAIQALSRCHVPVPPSPGSVMKIEHEYVRHGTMVYLAALDVHHMRLFGRCEAKSGIRPFDALVEQIMTQEPYRDAKRVFLVVDNGSSHRGEKCVRRLQDRYPNLVVVHGPIHASWLNQIEIYFSVLQRKVLTPIDVVRLEELERRIMAFQQHYETIAKPFEWKFTRTDLVALLQRVSPIAVTRAA